MDLLKLIVIPFLIFTTSVSSQIQERDPRLPTEEEIRIKFDKLNGIGPIGSFQRSGTIGNPVVLATGPEQDCSDAIPVCQQTYTQSVSYTGFGSIQEVNNTCLLSQENSSVWYIFTVQNSGTFGFTLSTQNDYDFALYDITANGCSGVSTSTPVRCNYSATYGNTGLSLPASGTVPLSYSAFDGPMMPGLNVTSGTTYALIIDNYTSDNNGYTLSFNGTASIFDATGPSISSSNVDCIANTVNVVFNEPIECASIAANGSDFTISGPGGSGPVTVNSALGVGCNGALTDEVLISFTPTAAIMSGTYTITMANGTDGNSIEDKCSNQSIGATYNFNYLAPIGITPSFSDVCVGNSSTLTANGDPSSGATYSWTPVTGSTNSIVVTPTVTTTYNLTVDYAGCSRSTTQTVTVVPPPIISVTPQNLTLCSGTATITATSTVGGSACTNCNYSWTGTVTQTDNNVSSSSILGAGAGSYTVAVTTQTGCAGNPITSTISSASSPPAPACNFLYVNTTGGGSGLTSSSPTDLITALGMASCNNVTIKMATGTYTHNNAISNMGSFVTLEGGYNSTFSNKESTQGATTIFRSSSNPEGAAGQQRLVAFYLNNSSNFRFQDLTIQTANATSTQMSTYGVHLTNCSDYDFVRARIIAGNATNGVSGTNGSTGTGGTSGAGGAGGSPGSGGLNGSCDSQSNPGHGGNGGVGGGAGAGGAGAGGVDGGGCCSTGVNGGAGGASTNFRAGGGGAGGACGGEEDNGGGGGGSGGGVNGGGGQCCGGGGGSGGDPGNNGGSGSTGVGGANGVNGANGSLGANGASFPFSHVGGFFVPGPVGGSGVNGGSGTNGTDGQGGKGGAGGGGGGGQGCLFCIDGAGSGGGGGGGGGQGGARGTAGGGGTPGTGGNGGGASYAVYLFNNGSNTRFDDCQFTSGTAGSGGSGGIGGNGGSGGSGGIGGSGGSGGFGSSYRSCGSGNEVGAGGNAGSGGKGGNAGSGGSGGKGGNGGNGASGETVTLYQNGGTAPVLSDVSFSLNTQPTITMDNLACTNVNINYIASVSQTWGMGAGSSPPAPVGTSVSTQYSTLGRKDIGYGANNYTGFANIITSPNPGTILASDTALCSGTITVTSSLAGNPGLAYFWSVAPAGTVNNPTDSATTIDLVNSGSSPQTFTVSLVITSQCCGPLTAITKDITVNPDPVAPTTLPDTTCTGGSATVSATAPAGASFDWYDASSGGTFLVTGNALVNNSLSATTSYYVEATNSFGCVSGSRTPAEMVAVPVSGPTTTDAIACDTGFVFPMVDTVQGAIAYNWYDAPAAGTLLQSGSGLTYASYIGTAGTIITYYVAVQIPGCDESARTPVNAEVTTNLIQTSPIIDSICLGQSTSLNANPSGGTGSFTYNWQPISSSDSSLANPTVTPPSSMSYSVEVTSGPCSVTAFVPVLISQPMTISFDTTDVACFGGSSGALEANVINGFSPYSFLWDANAASQTDSVATGLNIGTYWVTVTDIVGCQDSANALIVEPTDVVLSTDSVRVSCFGGSDGQATVTATGGVTPYTFIWDGNTGSQTTSTATGLSTGVYNATVTDANGCQKSAVVVVTENSQLNLALDSTAVTCYDSTNGTGTVLPSGGVSPYSYLWEDGQTTILATGFAPGLHYVTLTDAMGCVETDSLSIGEPMPVSYTTSFTDVNCSGGNDGTATVNVSGGSAPYGYVWDASAGGQTTSVASGLVAGNYQVTVTDANGCSPLFIPTSCFVIDAILVDACVPTNEGTQEMVRIRIGTSPLDVSTLTINWPNNSYNGICTDSAFVANTNTSITGGGYLIEPTGGILPAGANVVIVTSIGYDSSYMDFSSLIDTTYIIFQCDTNKFGHFANYVSGGGIRTLFMDFGAGCTSTVSYDRDSLVDQSGNSAAENGATVYFDYAENPILYANDGCVAPINNMVNDTVISVTISEPGPFTSNTDTTAVSCFGGNDGSATVIATGGIGSLSYAWDSNASNQTTTTATGLSSGMYYVTITDSMLCPILDSAVVTEPLALSASLVSNPALCFGDSNGTADITVSNGTPGYVYLWDSNANNQTTSSASGLSAGSYSVTVTDNNLCTLDTVISVSEPTGLSLAVSPTPNACFGDNFAEGYANAGGGTTPYSFLWDSGTGNQTDSIATGLTSGVYYVTVTDANSCAIIDSVQITDPPNLSVGFNVVNVNCFGGNDGSISAQPNGGSGTYSYSWDSNTGSQTTQLATGLNAGQYLITVTDSLGCVVNDSAIVIEPLLALNSVTSFTDPLCNNGSDGQSLMSVSGGTLPYNYQWDVSAGSQTDSLATGLSAGVYVVTATDANGCTVVDSASVSEPSALNLAPIGDTASCNGASDASASVNVSGGISPYAYLWDASAGSQTTQTANALGVGNYGVTVTDTNNCTSDTVVVISEPSVLSLSFNVIQSACSGGGTASATALPTGGTSPYSYTWNLAAGGQTSATATGLSTGVYALSLTDANGCITTDSANVNDPPPLGGSLSVSDVLCNGGNDGSITVTPSGGTSPFSYLWDVGAGSQATASASGLIAGLYHVTVTDTNSCTYMDSAIVSQPSKPLSAGTASVSPTCFGGANGSALISADGGTLPYTFLWDSLAGFQTDSLATGLSAGTYTALVTDSNGCTLNVTVVVSNPPAFSATLSGQNITCNGLTNGSVMATVSGGSTPYVISWSANAGGQTSTTITGLGAGIYSLTVQDAQGCIVSSNTSIGEPASLGITPVLSSPSCGGLSDGTASAGATGGVSPYSYFWQTNAGTQTSSVATGLNAGLHYITVTDLNGCSFADSVNMIDPLPIVLTINGTNPGCFGSNQGNAQATASGGVSPYTYVWGVNTGNQTGPIATALSAGVYVVTVSDNNGCQQPGSVTITEPAPLLLSGGSVDASCGADNGSAFVNVLGGVPSYSYLWNDSLSQTTNTANELPGGYYVVSVTDAAGCMDTVGFSVLDPSAVYADFTFDPQVGQPPLEVTFTDMSSGSINSWSWNLDNDTVYTLQNPIHVFQTSGDYDVELVVSSLSGCTDTFSVSIIIDALSMFQIPNVFTPNGDGINDVFRIIGTDLATTSAVIHNRWGELIYRWDAGENGRWDGRNISGGPVPDGVYYYEISATGLDGVEYYQQGFVSLIR